MFVLWFKTAKLSGKTTQLDCESFRNSDCVLLDVRLLSFVFPFGRLLFPFVSLYALTLEELSVFYCCCDLGPLSQPLGASVGMVTQEAKNLTPENSKGMRELAMTTGLMPCGSRTRVGFNGF